MIEFIATAWTGFVLGSLVLVSVLLVTYGLAWLWIASVYSIFLMIRRTIKGGGRMKTQLWINEEQR